MLFVLSLAPPSTSVQLPDADQSRSLFRHPLFDFEVENAIDDFDDFLNTHEDNRILFEDDNEASNDLNSVASDSTSSRCYQLSLASEDSFSYAVSETESKSTSNSSSDPLDLISDPVFRSRGLLFLSEDSEDSEADGALDLTADLPLAFYEHPMIREAYVRALLAQVFGRNTDAATQAMLESSKSLLQSMLVINPGLDEEFNLEHFAVTCLTLEW